MTMPPAGLARREEIDRAKQVCDSCVVYADCRAWVLSESPDPTPHMITAGMTLDERRAERRNLVSLRARR